MSRFRKPCGWGGWSRSDTRPPLPNWLSGDIVTHSQKYWHKIHWATPPWMNDEKLWDEMREVYNTASPTQQVDHIIPLSGVYVCGLHVPWNLEKLDGKANLFKSNDISYLNLVPLDLDDHEPHQTTLEGF